ncbi:MAG TPA: M56 family metallopeptidase [Flavobacterium sp.]|nr:M56 family metallopeptidase [Flavobacterium sp.]
METLFIYLIKSSALIAMFFLAYYFLLRKETFFKSNRWFLLLGLVTSLILPLVSFKRIVWIDAAPSMSWTDAPIALVPTEGFEINWYIIAAAVYAIGILNFLLEFAFDFGSLRRTLKGKKVTQQADFKFIDVTEKVSPFSYFNYIVYNSSLYSQAELDNILEHEKVHCEQYHSADVLISRLFCILFWYNPFVWLYKKVMLQNLEFIADSEALKNISDKKAYQITLLKVTTHENCVEITNHFYQSLIKKRIIMLNKNQSKKWNSWKYVLIIPALAVFMLYFQVKVIAQERENRNPDVVSRVISGESVAIVIDKNTSDSEMKDQAAMLKEKFGIKLKISKVKRNGAGEIIAIKVVYTDKANKSGTYQVSGDEPIKPLRFFRSDNGAISFGNAGGGKHVHIIKNDDGDTETVSESDSDSDSDSDQSYSYDYVLNSDGSVVTENIEGPEPPEPPDPMVPPVDVNTHVIVKTFKNKDGKIVVSVNGENTVVDTDEILSNIDFDKIQAEVEEQTKNAGKQMEIARRHIEKSQKNMRLRNQGNQDKSDLEEAERDLEQSRRDIEQSKLDLEQSKRDFEQSKRDFERNKAQILKQQAEQQAKNKAQAEAQKSKK